MVAGIAAVLCTIAPAAATASTVYVNSTAPLDAPACGATPSLPCKTIGKGVATASAGDTVSVAAGTYAEDVEVDKPLTLQGAQAGVDARTRTSAPAGETIVDGTSNAFHVTAGAVTIDGFLVQNTAGGPGIALAPTGAGYAIVDNIVKNNAYGIDLNTDAAPSASPTLVQHNVLSGNNQTGGSFTGYGIFGNQGLRNVRIDANRFTGGHASASIALGVHAPNQSLTISGNDYSNDNQVLIQNTQHLRVLDNRIVGSFGDGIAIGGNDSDVTVRGNEVREAGSSGITLLGALGRNDLLTIQGNALVHNGGYGLRAENGAFDATGTTVEFNRIAGNSKGGVRNDDQAQTLPMSFNWWGCNAGPGAPGCDAIADPVSSVDQTRWLTLTLGASPATISTGGDRSTVTASIRTPAGDTAPLSGFPVLPATNVALAASLGSIAPSAPFGTGDATATLTSGDLPGTSTITATLDSQTVQSTVAIVQPGNPDQSTTPGGTPPQTPQQPQQPQTPQTPQQPSGGGGGTKPTPLALLSPFPVIRIAGLTAPNGVRVKHLDITAPRGATIDVRCSGPRCPVKHVTRKSPGRSVQIGSLQRVLRQGVILAIAVTKPHTIGKYTRFRIRAGHPPVRTDRCLMPGRSTPVSCSWAAAQVVP
jgi:nitrous oxidase accessory protein NosD